MPKDDRDSVEIHNPTGEPIEFRETAEAKLVALLTSLEEDREPEPDELEPQAEGKLVALLVNYVVENYTHETVRLRLTFFGRSPHGLPVVRTISSEFVPAGEAQAHEVNFGMRFGRINEIKISRPELVSELACTWREPTT